jgi:threonine/homoserine/homoserine lactone efflux protein
MALLFNFIIAFSAAFIGVIPPGLINMSAAKISMKEGRRNATLFSLGVCVTVMLQTYIALLFARYLEKNPDVIASLEQVALGIFICITIYFLFIAKDTRRAIPDNLVRKSKKKRFFGGMFIASLNVLPLPYWVYVSVTFSAFGWFSFDTSELLTAVLASGIGTFIMLRLYVHFFKRKDTSRNTPLKVNMNFIIGAVTALISLITAFKIFKDL